MSTRSSSRERQFLDRNAPQDSTNPSTRIIPQDSTGGAPVETTWRTLNQLANLPRPATPSRRASSAGPPSTRRRTPSGQVRTPSGRKMGGSARRPVAVTPHGLAAQRELDLRRAGLTPGRDRRRSGIQQRDTPRETLRALSRLLAPKTKPIIPTPSPPGPSKTKSRRTIPDEDDLDDGLELHRPRLSLLIGDEDDEDDSLLLPPRSAGLEDENFTSHSIEIARRAISEQPLGRLSRGSFGSIRMSDVFADLNDTRLGDDGDISSYLADAGFGDVYDSNMLDETNLPTENTETLQNVSFNQARMSATGRESDIRPANLGGDDTETTFVFTVPHREISEEPQLVERSPSPLLGEQSDSSDNDDDDVAMDFAEAEVVGSPEFTSDETTVLDPTQDVSIAMEKNRVIKKKKVKVSKHGLQYSSLPVGVVKKLATKFARTSGNSKAKINKETLEAIMQATDWFFEQVGEDLGAYAKHAARKTIDETDIVTLMARQRQTNATTTPFSLAQKHLPRELLQEMRMVPPPKSERGRQLDTVEEVNED